MSYLDVINRRRSVYALSDQLPIPEEELVRTVEEAVVASPSPFNVQSGRAVVLLGGQHRALWNEVVRPALEAVVPAGSFAPTAEKLAGFAAGAGTVLFFENRPAVEDLKTRFPTYAAAFDGFAEHALGMIEVNVWNALAERGVGASLQHYNPLIDDAVKARWGVPAEWALASQMVFGGISAPAAPIEKLPASERVRVVR